MEFRDLVNSGEPILTEGSIVERLRRSGPLPLDPDFVHAKFVLTPEGRAALTPLYRQYLDIAAAHDLPILTFTGTWRTYQERAERAGVPLGEINHACARFLQELRHEYSGFRDKVFIGGLMGCRGDAYKPSEALSEADAAAFHLPQARALAEAGVDFLIAETLPALSEATGLAQTLAATGVAYSIGFVLNRAGQLLDGTPLSRAIEHIDASASPAPIFYTANCCYPTFLEAAFDSEKQFVPLFSKRLIGIMANGSSRSADELEGLPFLDQEDPGRFASDMMRLRDRFGTRILGGCCGTDDRHIAALARAIRSTRD